MEKETAPRREVIRFSDKEALSRDAANRFATLASQRSQRKEPFTVALAGGSTPATLYRLLTLAPLRERIPWLDVQLFFGDERCVPLDSPDSNFHMVNETLLQAVASPIGGIHFMPGNLPNHEAAAREYEETLRAFFRLAPGELPRFDLILLGMGPDGHCASLFPHKPALHEKERLVVASEPGLKPFVPRLTLTFPVINNAANILFLVAGEDKAETLARVLEGAPDSEALPSQSVVPTNGMLTWLVDQAAARHLKTL